MRERLRPSDYRFLAICLTLLAATTWFSVRNFHRAFPEASIDFRVNREEARSIAERFLAARGFRLADYRHAARFSFDDNAKTFLEREAGLEEANRLMATRVRLWRWSNRWFRPQRKEEFRVDVTPGGEVTGFEHQIAEAEARPSLSPDEARAAAERFLREVARRDPGVLEFVEGSMLARPARTDHVFTWKESGFTFKEADNRIEIRVLGAEIGGYREYLKVPEQWRRGYERLRSGNQAAQSVDSALTVLLAVGLLAWLVICVRARQVMWRRAALVGLVGGVLTVLSQWNEFPLNEFFFPNTDSYPSFVSRQLLNSILAGLGAAGFLFVLTAAAEPLYRETFGRQLSLGNLFRPRGLRTRSFLLGTVLGIALTGIFVAYQTAFYMVAYRFGAWSPADVPYTELLNTRLPWAFVLFGGFFPAVTEEFLFRVFAVPYLRKIVRSAAVAIVVAGFLWGFGHAGYPQQPFYIRGVEVGIGGVALGLILLRWGILPALVWHYSVDAMYSAMLLMRSQSLYFKLSGAAAAGIMLLPVAIALAAYFRNGGFEPEAGMTNADERREAPPDEAAAEARPAPADDAAAVARWPAALRAAALGLFALGAACVLWQQPRIGSGPKYKLSRAQALAAADSFLRERRADPAVFRHVVFPDARWQGDDSLAAKYLLERRPVGEVEKMFEANRHIQYWGVRYFRALDKEEFTVAVHPETGKVTGFVHILPEDRAGADLPPDAAAGVAAAFARTRGYDVGSMDLKEKTSEKRKARRDHTLVWEARPGDPRNVEEARFRVVVEVDGDEVTGLRAFWKTPEAFARARSRQNAISILLMSLKIAVLSGAVVFGLVFLFQAIRRGAVRWGPALRIAIPLTVLTAAGALLSYPLAWRGYNTAIPIGIFEATLITGMAITLAFSFLMATASVAFVQVSAPGAFEVFRTKARAAMGIDAALAVLAATGLAGVVSSLRTFLLGRFHGQAIYPVGAPDLIATAAPALSALASAAGAALLWCASFALAAHILGRIRGRPLAVLALAAAAASTMPGGVRTPGEALLAFAGVVLPLGAALVFALVFARRNLLAYGLAAWALALRGPIAELLEQPNPSLQLQGWIVAAVLAATLAWAAMPARPARIS